MIKPLHLITSIQNTLSIIRNNKMSVKFDSSSLKGAEESTLHLLPCEIESDGNAKVQQYFTPTITKGDMTASFRGRPLAGEKMELPSGYTGIVMREPIKTFNEDEERQFKASHTFKDFTYWNLDTPPTENDHIKKAMKWFDLANVIHSPVGETKVTDT